METISFDKLLLKSAFCCMASDGDIDEREIALIRKMCTNSSLFGNIDFHDEINGLVKNINLLGKAFLASYFDQLAKASLTESEELTIIDFAIQTIEADEQIEYSEIKFFKNIRHRLKITNEKILARFPEIERFLEEDILIDSSLEKITNQYLDEVEKPQFKMIVSLDKGLFDNLTQD